MKIHCGKFNISNNNDIYDKDDKNRKNGNNGNSIDKIVYNSYPNSK